MAYEIGVEHAEFKLGGQKVAGQIRVTNIYKREAGAWKISHYHADLLPAMVEVLNRLQPPSMKA